MEAIKKKDKLSGYLFGAIDKNILDSIVQLYNSLTWNGNPAQVNPNQIMIKSYEKVKEHNNGNKKCIPSQVRPLGFKV